MSALREVMTAHVEKGTVPGLVAAVARDGEVAVEALGTTAYPGGGRPAEPVRRDTVFRITSMTKPMVAVAAMELVEDGRLALDEPVDRLLPELADRRVLRDPAGPVDETVPARRPVLVSELLDFRWGFGFADLDAFASPVWRASVELGLAFGPPLPPSPHDPDEWMRRLGTLPLMHQPGDRWLYDAGTAVAGVLVARAAGAPLPDALAQLVFEPLGMADTGFHVPAGELHRLPPQWDVDPETGAPVLHDPPDGAWSRPPAFPSGSAGLVSTVDDYLAFALMLLRGGAPLLRPQSVRAMTTDRLTPSQHGSMFLGDRGWGLGVSVTPSGRYGWEGGAGTSWANDPATGTVGVLLTQRMLSAPVLELMDDFRAVAFGQRA